MQGSFVCVSFGIWNGCFSILSILSVCQTFKVNWYFERSIDVQLSIAYINFYREYIVSLLPFILNNKSAVLWIVIHQKQSNKKYTTVFSQEFNIAQHNWANTLIYARSFTAMICRRWEMEAFLLLSDEEKNLKSVSRILYVDLCERNVYFFLQSASNFQM